MDFLRKHWFDLGGVLSIVVLLFMYVTYQSMSDYQLLMWASLVSLFFHQLEEYRIIGTFPGMLNKVMFKSKQPDRYPLNTNSALFVNVFMGWAFYFLAALFSEKCVWLGMATILVSMGNIVAHTIIFNIKGKSLFNAGLITSWIFFVPISILFWVIVYSHNLATIMDYIVGIMLGLALNFVGILKMIDWMKDPNTPYIFPKRCLV